MIWLKILWRICFILLCSIMAAPVFSQKITAALSRNTLLIGEQVTLQVKLENIDPQKWQLVSWKPVADSVNHLQVVSSGKLDSIFSNGQTVYTQQLTLTSFDTGSWKCMPLAVELLQFSDGKKQWIHGDSLSLKILPVDISGMQDYHDIKDILEVKVAPPYFKYGLIVLAALTALVLAWLIIRKTKKKKIVVLPQEDTIATYERSLRQLEKMKKENPATHPAIKLFYTRLTDICKTYSSEILPVKATHLTTDEAMIRLKPYLANEKARIAFFHLLRYADAIKFAKYNPPHPEMENDIVTAISFIQYIHDQHEKPLT